MYKRGRDTIAPRQQSSEGNNALLAEFNMSKPTFVLTIILLILLFNASAGQTIVVKNDNAVTPKLIKKYSRKILTEVQDYDYGGANSRHDPRRRPGIGGRNR